MSAQRPHCSICADPKKEDWVARRTLEGYSSNQMEAFSREVSSPIAPMKRETIKAHNDICVGGAGVSQKQIASAAPPLPPPGDPNDRADVAVLVQREVIAKLKAGEARVTVQHGLQAQQLLDKREERRKDRELAITLARMLYTPAPPPDLIEARPIIIDGEAVEVA